MNRPPLVRVINLTRNFVKGSTHFHILKGISIEVEGNETIGIAGVSGAGKTTFLQILGALDRPTGGEVFIDGTNVFSLKNDERSEFRRRNIGFIFQAYNLLPEFNAVENVMLPFMIDGLSRDEAFERASALLAKVGLKERTLHRTGELSGGEQQRVAIARAISLGPRVILADEPTGNLDRKTEEMIITLLGEIITSEGSTLIMVTHNEKLISRFGRRLKMDDGKIVED